MKHLTVGIMAHVDSGKTTLAEAILYHAGEIRRRGRVDHGDSWLDTDEIERSRGITIFAHQASFRLGELTVTLLDTPGHVDFSAETERTMQVLDCAVLVISGTDGVQSHTRTLWRLLDRYGIPVILFVNKMDLAEKNETALMQELQARLSPACSLSPARKLSARLPQPVTSSSWKPILTPEQFLRSCCAMPSCSAGSSPAASVPQGT